MMHLLLPVLVGCLCSSHAFITEPNLSTVNRRKFQRVPRFASQVKELEVSSYRRSIVISPIVSSLSLILTTDPKTALAADGNLNVLVGQLKEAGKMMDDIPDLIKTEQWDAVRAILIKPPLSNLWASGGTKQLLKQYAEAIGNELPDGDEMLALELREDAISHLRYLDMAVYNNVFNPISTEGQSGATKELIRSYYEDPTNEWKASKAAIDSLISLATP